MVGRCANHPCTASFHSLHKGRLFVMAPRRSSASDGPHKLIYVWLCEVCSRTMMASLKDGEVRVAPIPESATVTIP